MFPEEKRFTLTNVSKVPFTYRLHIPGDSHNPDEKEFEISPIEAEIMADGSKKGESE